MLIDEYYWHLEIQDFRIKVNVFSKYILNCNLECIDQNIQKCRQSYQFVMSHGLYFIIELYVCVFFHLLLGNLLFGIKLSFWAPTVLSQTCNHAASVSNKHILLMLYIFYDNNMKTKTKNKLAVNRKFVDIHYEGLFEY